MSKAKADTDYEKFIVKVKEGENVKTVVIGVDAGGVLFEHKKEQSITDINKNGHSSVTDVMPGVIESLNNLKEYFKANKILAEFVVVSFAGSTTAQETFVAICEKFPGIFHSFCFVNSKEAKTPVCEYLGIDIFIDDSSNIFTGVVVEKKGVKNIAEGLIDLAIRTKNPIISILFGHQEDESKVDATVSCTTWKDVDAFVRSINFEKMIPNKPNYNLPYKIIKDSMYKDMHTVSCLKGVKQKLLEKSGKCLK